MPGTLVELNVRTQMHSPLIEEDETHTMGDIPRKSTFGDMVVKYKKNNLYRCLCCHFMPSVPPQVGVWLSSLIYATMTLLLHYSCGTEVNNTALSIVLPFTFISLFLMVSANLWVIRNIGSLSLYSCWMVYFITTISFAIIDLALYVYDTGSHTINLELVDNADGIKFTDLSCIFLYYSVSVQTLTGYGDIYASTFLASIWCVLQMLFGIMYSVAFIALALPQSGNAELFKRLRRESEVHQNCWNRLKHHEVVRAIRVRLRKHLLLLMIIIEFGKYLALASLSTRDLFDADATFSSSLVLCCLVIGIFEIFVLFFTSLKLASKPQEVRASFLVQSYMATIIVFGGIYLTLQLLRPADKAWTLHINSKKSLEFYIWSFTYHSVTTMTNSGINNLGPTIWYSCFACACQMLIGVFFHIVIFGLCVNEIINKITSLKEVEENLTTLKQIRGTTPVSSLPSMSSTYTTSMI